MKDIKDYLPLYYGSLAIINGEIKKITAYHVEFFENYYEIKPLLRPIFSIKSTDIQQTMEKINSCARDEQFMSQTHYFDLTRLLLTNSYDIFNLIEDGLAMNIHAYKQFNPLVIEIIREQYSLY